MEIVIIEDEKPSARKLLRMLDKLGFNAEVMLHSVEESVAWFKSNPHPDLILLDIQLSDGLSFEIFDEVEVQSSIIFTTAYDEYALQAFKLNSIDYLLKPIDPEELNKAIKKYEDRLPAKQHLDIDFNEIKKMLINPMDREYKKRFSIKIGQHLKLVNVKDVSCIYSENKGTYINTNDGRNYLVDDSLEQLSDQLEPQVFFRVSRKYFVNINAIKDMLAYSNSRLLIKLNSEFNQEIIVARERVKAFKNWLDN